MKGDVGALNLTSLKAPGITLYPAMVEGDLVLSHGSYTASSTSSDHSTNTAGSSALSAASSSSETVASSSEAGSGGRSNSSYNISNGSSKIEADGDGEGSGFVSFGRNHSGVVWRVAALEKSVSGVSEMEWTIFPSTGLLLPGER